jgi:hypothetical protein
LGITQDIKETIVSFFVVKYFPHYTVLNKDHEVVHNYKDYKGGKWEDYKLEALFIEKDVKD